MHFLGLSSLVSLLAASLASASPLSAHPPLAPRTPPCSIPYTHVNNTHAVSFLKREFETVHAVVMWRYSFSVDDQTLINNRGIDILNRLRCHDGGGIYNNWQFYQNVLFEWIMEFNEVSLLSEGEAAVDKAIQDVTGQSPAVPV